jgi:hypothetical protein
MFRGSGLGLPINLLSFLPIIFVTASQAIARKNNT